MKPILAALVVISSLASAGYPTHASEPDKNLSRPVMKRPEIQVPGIDDRSLYSGIPPTCVYKERKSELLHVMTCRVKNSERCILIAPVPQQDLLRSFAGVKILKIALMPDGCIKLTFRGSLKSPE